MKFDDLNQIADEYNVGRGQSDWMKLVEGDNPIRLVSEFEVLPQHYGGKGTKPMICVGIKKGCFRCEAAKEWTEEQKKLPKEQKSKTPNPHKISPRFKMWVIDRKDGKIKILDTGWTVVDEIRKLSQDEEYGFNPLTGLPDYDIKIKKELKNPADPKSTTYSVVASRTNKPLTPEEQAAVNELKPIKEIVDAMKGKVLKEYEDFGVTGDDTPPPADIGDEPPPPDPLA